MAGLSHPSYDSDEARRPLLSEIRNFRDYWGLIRLLVLRDLTVRYKRSTLGIWWTLLNPLLTTAVMFAIFSNLFRFDTGDVPYVVYLLSGILLATFFAQGVLACSSAIVNSASVLSKVYVPPEVFSLSAAVAASVNFLISLIPLVIAQLVTGVGIPWTALLVPLPALAMLALVTGLGLLVASLAVYFYDVLDLTQVILQLLTYMIPTFYIMDIVPATFQPFITSNPLYSYLLVFRGFVYGGTFAPAQNFIVMFGSAILVLGIGVWVFSRSWKNLVVLL
jgi:ABC-2 type transport system permease protein